MTEEYDGLRLHELVSSREWEKLVARLKTHPHEALHVVDDLRWLGRKQMSNVSLVVDDSNITALHLLCAQASNVPRQVIRAFLEAQPKAIRILTEDKKSPLSLAVLAGASATKVLIVAKAYPDSVLVQDVDGENVFHILCQRVSPPENLIGSLMNQVGADRTQQALLMTDRRNDAPIHCACSHLSRVRVDDFALIFQQTRIESLDKNPLVVLCREYRTNFHACLQTSPIPNAAVSTDDPSPYCSPNQLLSLERFWMWRPTDALFLRRAWAMVFVLLGAYGADTSTYPLLHECIERDALCACNMFDLILCLNPHYACQIRESDGTLPLHVLCRLAAQDGQQHWVERIRMLVRLYPKAASIPDPEGHLPLEILASPPVIFDHVVPVLNAHPSALARLDLPETWYPYVLAKLGTNGSSSTIFEILRTTPTLAAI